MKKVKTLQGLQRYIGEPAISLFTNVTFLTFVTSAAA
jgi:hypothetical protein